MEEEENTNKCPALIDYGSVWYCCAMDTIIFEIGKSKIAFEITVDIIS